MKIKEILSESSIPTNILVQITAKPSSTPAQFEETVKTLGFKSAADFTQKTGKTFDDLKGLSWSTDGKKVTIKKDAAPAKAINGFYVKYKASWPGGNSVFGFVQDCGKAKPEQVAKLIKTMQDDAAPLYDFLTALVQDSESLDSDESESIKIKVQSITYVTDPKQQGVSTAEKMPLKDFLQDTGYRM